MTPEAKEAAREAETAFNILQRKSGVIAAAYMLDSTTLPA
jgi:hypothetical protein